LLQQEVFQQLRDSCFTALKPHTVVARKIHTASILHMGLVYCCGTSIFLSLLKLDLYLFTAALTREDILFVV
jgi:hypothetical protein